VQFNESFGVWWEDLLEDGLFEDGELDGESIGTPAEAGTGGGGVVAPVVGDPPIEAGAGVDLPPGVPPVEVAPVDDVPPAGSPPADAPPASVGEWNGSLDTLESVQGWTEVPEASQTAIKVGLDKILKGWQRTSTTKLEMAAAQQRQNEEDRADLVKLEENWLKMVSGEDDPLKAKDTRITELEQQLAARPEAGAATADSIQAAVTKAQEVWTREKDTLTQERDTAKTEYTTFSTAVEEAYRDHLAEWVVEHAADLVDDGKEQGLELLLDLHAKNHSLEAALSMVRGHPKFAAPPSVVPAVPTKPAEPAEPTEPPGPQEVPDAIELQNMPDRAVKKSTAGKPLHELSEDLYRKNNEIAQWQR